MNMNVKINADHITGSDFILYFKGKAFMVNDTSALIDMGKHFKNVKSKDEFKSLVSMLNGFFCVILKREGVIFAAVDRIRSMPLFYGNIGNNFFISDDAYWVQRKLNSYKKDELTRSEFCLTGYVTGFDTLCPDIKQLRAGELLVAKLENESIKINTDRYYKYFKKEEIIYDYTYLLKKLDDVLIHSFERLLKIANGKTIAVPLSGGFDSRLVALMLKRLGKKEILSFTYGRYENLESKISKNVAKHLDISWAFVLYTNKFWCEWFRTHERQKYYDFAHQIASLPHIQDWPAVWELKKQKAIPENAIFVPGHTGDFISGGHIYPSLLFLRKVSSKEIAKEIFKRHYNLVKISKWNQSHLYNCLIYRISNNIQHFDCVDSEIATWVCDKWNWQERQAKFIVNSVRVYEFWGYQWWLPLWDYEFIDFWTMVPIQYRIGQKIYIEYVNKLTEEILGRRECSAILSVKEMNQKRMGLIKNYIKGNKKLYCFSGKVKDKIDLIRKFFFEYDRHFLCWFGIMKRKVFKKYLFMTNGHINAFQALELLKIIKFD